MNYTHARRLIILMAAPALALIALAACGASSAPAWCATAEHLQITSAEPAAVQADLSTYQTALAHEQQDPNDIQIYADGFAALRLMGTVATRDGCPGMKP